ncbi:MAG: sigma 54-interacting transcriptional regulator [Candidatus Brocadiaceae bacterium]|nr:sigma 54-interacting transcriptional regulator [Candidatus Brocadiaceae bacterium]
MHQRTINDKPMSIQQLSEYAKDLRVLLVEDEDELRRELARYLSDFFEHVDVAQNGHEGLNKYSQMRPDIIITDVRMPDIDGIEMVKRMKRIHNTQPFIVISAYSDSDILIEFINTGVDHFILKPIHEQKFLNALLNLCTEIVHKRMLDTYKANLEAIFRSVKDAIIMVDKNLVVLEVNDATQEICGFSHEEAINKPFLSLFAECKEQCFSILKKTIETGQTMEIHRQECFKKNRIGKIVTITTHPLIDCHGTINGSVMVIKDETNLISTGRDSKEIKQFRNIIGKSEKMQKLYSIIATLSELQTTVLITSETGTGKELVAEALHNSKNGEEKPFVKVNWAALSEDLLESELFGHVKGAFTGAIKDRIGRFQQADGGTIFLDEIGDISSKMQLRLLRVLQESEFECVGDSNPVKVNVRVIAATNQDLREKVRLGKFREDLYHRLKVVELQIPPLRERYEDMFLLVEYFLKRLNEKFGSNITHISDDVFNLFLKYRWPGNIRELQHVLERAYIYCRQTTITLVDLPQDLLDAIDAEETPTKEERSPYDRLSIVQALQKTDWNKAKAARLLGIDRKTIYSKIAQYHIKKERVDRRM